MKKRVIFVSGLTLWSMGKNRGGPAFTQTVKKYIDEGWEVYFISDVPSNKDCTFFEPGHNIVLKPSCFKRFVGLRKIGALMRWLDHRTATGRFATEMERLLKSDTENTILYAYEIFGVLSCSRISKKYNVPMVTRFQGTILSQFKNTFYNRIGRYPHFQALEQKADLVIMTDDGTQGDRVLQALKNDSKTLFLRNGLELCEKNLEQMRAEFNRERFRARLGVEPDEPMFLTVSRLEGWKRVDRVIDGFAEYGAEHDKGKLVIVGDGAAKESLKERADEKGVKDRVVFTGSVAHEDVYNYMMACDVFLSLYDLSNVGNPLLEAMTLGRCIVTLDVGDTGKLIENRVNGILLKPEELTNIATIMSELAGNAKLRYYLGMQAESYAMTNFESWKKRMDTEFRELSGLV